MPATSCRTCWSRRIAGCPDFLETRQLPFHLWLRQMAQDRMIDAHRRHRGAARRSIDRERPLHSPALADQSSVDLAALIRDRQLTPAATAARHELEARFRRRSTRSTRPTAR